MQPQWERAEQGLQQGACLAAYAAPTSVHRAHGGSMHALYDLTAASLSLSRRVIQLSHVISICFCDFYLEVAEEIRPNPTFLHPGQIVNSHKGSAVLTAL